MAVKAAAKKTSSAVSKPPELFYRINSLLYTLRTIAQREDQLCVLMHHLRTSGKLNAELAAELQEIVEEIPTEEYLQDVRALQRSLEAVAPAPARTRASALRGRQRAVESRQ